MQTIEQTFALVKHTGATGGMLVAPSGVGHRLTPIQFELLSVLWERQKEEDGKHNTVRGYVSSTELLCSLPWDAVRPDLAHLKQLIRRLRRRLEPLGVGLEACYGLGYRLKFDPKDKTSCLSGRMNLT